MLNLSQIIHHFFRKEELEQVSEKELRQFITLYPYSTAGHLLLVKKLKDAGDKRAFEKEVNSAAIYFNNPVWLQWLLNGEETPETPDLSRIEMNSQQHELTIYEDIEDIINETPGKKIDASVYSTAEQEPEHRPYDFESRDSHEEYRETSGNGHDVTDNDHTEFSRESVTDTNGDTNDVLEEKSVEELQNENLVQGIPNEETPIYTRTEEEQINSAANDQSFDIPAAEHTTPEKEESLPEPEQIHEISQHEFISPDNNNIDELQSKVEGPVNNPEENQQPEPTIQEPELNSAQQEPNVHSIEQQELPSTHSEPTIEQPELSNQQPEPRAQNPEPSTQHPEPLTFEPYHTVDYFASQGIKLRQEELNRDKLGQQLRSFTEWLRSMKKVPGQAISTNMDESVQQSIQRFAEHSVQEKEVLTEAMAEVWAKQGNRQKAVLIYQKLSLQNPDKSAYFAAKIDQLNAL